MNAKTSSTKTPPTTEKPDYRPESTTTQQGSIQKYGLGLVGVQYERQPDTGFHCATPDEQRRTTTKGSHTSRLPFNPEIP